jgi:hypothetical protein
MRLYVGGKIKGGRGMINLWAEETRRADLKRKRKNWALLTIVMFLLGMIFGHLFIGCMFRTNFYEDERISIDEERGNR